MMRLIVPVLCVFVLAACTDTALLDRSFAFEERGWSYEVRPSFELDVNDTSSAYSLFLNLRHTGEYPYSNLFILLSVVGPEKDTVTNRFEFTLANPDGRWLGERGAQLYSYQIPFSDSTHFRKPGRYTFIMEQNMRDPVLPAIEDIGLRIEKRP